MKVLVVGGGGREHALAWKIEQSPFVEEVLCAPGNPGTLALAKCRNVQVGATDLDGITALARRECVDLVVVGPEVPLAAGLADRLYHWEIPTFGPGATGALMEESKQYAKERMRAWGVPTARARLVTSFSAFGEEIEQRTGHGFPVVVKFNGLAAGKGVVIAHTPREALAAGKAMLVERQFGDGAVLLEEFLGDGRELSALVVTDGLDFQLLATSQDYKRIGDDNVGPNTGGMGAISPAPAATPEFMAAVLEQVVERTVFGMRDYGIPYQGCLYVGLMATEEGPMVVEFNCRFGDPETQVVLPRLTSDLVPLLMAVATGDMSAVPPLEWDPRPAICVVLASEGYPESSSKGDIITGVAEAESMEDVVVFHAGTAIQDGNLVTAGGRVLNITAIGDTVEQARKRAYAAVSRISFRGMQFRTDIGL